MRNRVFWKKRRKDDRGETIVEVMVAFIVLLIVLMVFGNSILAAGEAQKYAIETRKEADQGMLQLQKKRHENGSGAKETGVSKTAVVEGLDQEYAIKAVQYESDVTDGKLTYWVFE
ncbi:MAG: prepilin-type N-terminal cleavage/methylation domain-containing protein [Lachnospiraceae bacterium]|nr:prepilin-type N-terminal cleavage/methylation domain-containing protein [Lachnospiraceae bacterium]